MKRTVWATGCALLFVGLWTVSAADPPAGGGAMTDPVEILKKADDACKAVKSLTYKLTFKGLGADEVRAPKLSGTVSLLGRKASGADKYRCEVTVTPPGATEAIQVTGGSNGKSYFVVDAKNKKVYEDIDPAMFGSFRRAIFGAIVQEYLHPTPFTDEINGVTKELKGVEKVGSEDCYHVFVKYQQETIEADWYFSTKDFLPRRVDRGFTPPGDGPKGGSQVMVTDLKLDPELDPKTFEPVVPEGYTKVDDFAP